MKLRTYVLVCLLSLGAFSSICCSKKDAVEQKPSAAATKSQGHKPNNSKTLPESSNLAFLTFGFPQQVEGCSCYFAANRTQFIKQNYIYVDDYEKNAFVRLEEELISLPFRKNTQTAPDSQLLLQFKTPEYQLKIQASRIDQGEIETALYQGEMTLTTENGAQISSPVYGECSC